MARAHGEHAACARRRFKPPDIESGDAGASRSSCTIEHEYSKRRHAPQPWGSRSHLTCDARYPQHASIMDSERNVDVIPCDCDTADMLRSSCPSLLTLPVMREEIGRGIEDGRLCTSRMSRPRPEPTRCTDPGAATGHRGLLFSPTLFYTSTSGDKKQKALNGTGRTRNDIDTGMDCGLQKTPYIWPHRSPIPHHARATTLPAVRRRPVRPFGIPRCLHIKVKAIR